MISFRYNIKYIFLFLFLIFFPIKNYAHEKQVNILVLLTNHSSLPWTKSFLKGLEETEELYSHKQKFFIENMAVYHLGESLSQKEWMSYLKRKYKNIQIDAILAESNEASVFVQKYVKKEFTDIPLVYYVTKSIKTGAFEKALVTQNGSSIEGTVKLALEQNPKAKNAFIIDGAVKTATINAQMIKEELEKQSDINIEIIKDFSLTRLKEQVTQLPEESILFYTIVFQDNTGKKFLPRDVLSNITDVADIPIYTFYTSLMMEGIVGGYMIDGKITAKEMVRASMDYIENGYFENIYSNVATYIDQKSIDKYEIDQDTISEDTILLNKRIHIWESDFYEVLFLVLFIIAMYVVMGYIMLNSINLKKANQRIKEEVDARMEQDRVLAQQSKMATMGEMISMIAHQWRQPLNIISIIKNNLLIDIELGEMNEEEIKNGLNSINKQVEHMTHTMNDFRNFYKPNANLKKFSALKQISQVYKLLSAKFEALGVEFELVGDEEYMIYGLENELSQVLLNIYNNSCDAFEEENIRQGRIETNLEKIENTLIISIKDNGRGIPDFLLPTELFSSFISTKGDKGTGIGLTMSKKIIEEHFGGKIWARNWEEGAEFIIEIPFKEKSQR